MQKRTICSKRADFPFFMLEKYRGVWLNKFKIKYPSRLQKRFTNCKLMCPEDFPKLWCRYEIFVLNRAWNSEILTLLIQQKISRKVTERDSQKLLLNSKTVKKNYLGPPCAYQRVGELKFPGTRLITRSQLGRLLQNVMTNNFRAWFFSSQP